MAKARRGYRTIKLELKQGTAIPVRAAPRVADAMKEITAKSTLYEGVRLTQVMEAMYLQGKKDGAREAFEQIEKGMAEAKRRIPHRGPGRPRLRRSN